MSPDYASFWTVRFKTNDGAYHPVWYVERGGPLIHRDVINKAARRYMLQKRGWLKSFEIYSTEHKESK